MRAGSIGAEIHPFPVELRRGGSPGCCSGSPACSCCGSLTGSSRRCCSNCRRVSRGSNLWHAPIPNHSTSAEGCTSVPFRECTKCLGAELGFAFVDSPGDEIGIQMVQPLGESQSAAPIQDDAVRKDAVSEEVHPMPRAIEEGLDFELETEPVQLRPERGPHRFEIVFTIRPGDEVVHVANVAAAMDNRGRMTVDGVEVEIRAVLRDQTADGETTFVARTMGMEDLGKQFQQPIFRENAVQPIHQTRLGNALEILPHIGFQKPFAPSGKTTCRREGGELAFSPSAGVGVVDESVFELRLANIHDRVVEDPLGEAGRGDEPFLRVVDGKLGADSNFDVATAELTGEVVQVFIETGDIGFGITFATLTAQCFLHGEEEIRPFRDAVKELFRPAHVQ